MSKMEKFLPKLNTPKFKTRHKILKLDIPTPAIDSIHDFKQVEFKPDDDFHNGFIFGKCYLPEDIICHILSFLNAKTLLKLSQVCKSWHKIVRSHSVWMMLYKKLYNKRPKKLPWFVYYSLFTQNFFDTNLLKNGDATQGLKYWDLNHSNPGYLIERVPVAYNNLPQCISHCFTTYIHTNVPRCSKSQKVHLANGLFADIILDYYKPHINISEYIFNFRDYNAAYELKAYLLTTVWQKPEEHKLLHEFKSSSSRNWVKKEMTITDYLKNTRKLEFYHATYDTNKEYIGHYGTLMTGGNVKVLFDSIEPKINDKYIVE